MAAPIGAACRRYVMLLAHEHLEFRLPEVLSIAKLFNIPMKIPEGGYNMNSPYLVVDLPSEDCAKKIMSRTMLVKSIYELWGQGKCYEEVKRSIQMFPSHFKMPYFAKNKSFCIRLESFNKIVDMAEKIRKFEFLTSPDTLPFQGRVNLKNPDELFQILEYYGMQTSEPPVNPYVIYFGRWVADGQRSHIQEYRLDKRKFIGNTSMDAGLSFIMSNMGAVKPGDIVFDPFVGTGSLLVSAAHFGAYVMGTDLDYKIIHGIGRASRHNQKWRGRDENIRANLQQYGLQNHYLDVLVADASKHTMWRQANLFDAIITDPPYGVREKTKKVGTDEIGLNIPDHLKEGHIPKRIEYELSELMLDLLNFSAQYLKLGGRLVFWLPVYRPEYVEENVPQHPCFQVVANSEQSLAVRVGRRLITMEKVKEYEEKDFESKAKWIEDHFKDFSFRDKYFRPQNWQGLRRSPPDVHGPPDINSQESMPDDLPGCSVKQNSDSNFQGEDLIGSYHVKDKQCELIDNDLHLDNEECLRKKCDKKLQNCDKDSNEEINREEKNAQVL